LNPETLALLAPKLFELQDTTSNFWTDSEMYSVNTVKTSKTYPCWWTSPIPLYILPLQWDFNHCD